MMVSLRHRLVILAMPKCASSAIESALAPHMDVVIRGVPSAKHTPYRKYDRFLRKYLEGLSEGPLETVCLFREPIDWLNSWWRYRGRSGVPNRKRSTKTMTFNAFVERYLDGAAPPADVGRQSRFISDAKGNPSVDHILSYDDMAPFIELISNRMGIQVELGRENVSPPAHLDEGLSPDTERRLREDLALDFEIYASV